MMHADMNQEQTYFLYTTDFYFHSTGLGPNSKVISTVLHPHPQEKITPPVTVVLSHIKVSASETD